MSPHEFAVTDQTQENITGMLLPASMPLI